MCFHPLAGLFISKYMSEKLQGKKDCKGFHPLAGLFISKYYSVPSITKATAVSFHPLAGLFISKSCPLYPAVYQGYNAYLRRKSISAIFFHQKKMKNR